MENTVEIENIISQAMKLDYEERLHLLEELIKKLKISKKKTQTHNLTELSGLGAEIWKDIDIDEYVQQERKWSN